MGEMEKFFLLGCQVNEIEIKELLLHRYGRYDFPEMKFDEFIEFLVLAINNDKKEKMHGEYLALLPSLIQVGKYMSFEEFYKKMTGANIDWRKGEDILKEAEEIQARFNNGG